MVEGSSYMFITGPDVVKTVTGEEVSSRSSEGRHACTKSGVAHFIAPDEKACLEDARYLLSFLPQDNLDPPPFVQPSDPLDREEAELDRLIPDDPNKPYDMHDVVRRVVDDGDFLEVHERWAENIVCGFARLGGQPVGVVGNQPRSLGRGARHRLVGEGGPVRSDLRRLQHSAGHVRGRARLPARDGAGVGRDHPARRQAALRVREATVPKLR